VSNVTYLICEACVKGYCRQPPGHENPQLVMGAETQRRWREYVDRLMLEAGLIHENTLRELRDAVLEEAAAVADLPEAQREQRAIGACIRALKHRI